MRTNMNEASSQQQGLVDLNEWKRSRSGCKRTRLPVPIPLNVQRPLDVAMHGAFVKWRGSDGQIPDRRVQKVNEGHARPWRRLADFLYLARVCGVSYEHVKAVIRALDWWTDALYGNASTTSPTAELLQRAHSNEIPNDGDEPKRAA